MREINPHAKCSKMQKKRKITTRKFPNLSVIDKMSGTKEQIL